MTLDLSVHLGSECVCSPPTCTEMPEEVKDQGPVCSRHLLMGSSPGAANLSGSHGAKTANFNSFQFSSVQFTCSVVSDSLRPHESQHARLRVGHD